MGRTKKRKYRPSASTRFNVDPSINLPSVIVSFNNGKSKQVLRDCNNIYETYKDLIISTDNNPKKDDLIDNSDSIDISAAISSELEEIKEEKTSLVMDIKTVSVKNMKVLQFRDCTGTFSSVEFIRTIFKDIKEKQKAKARYIHRMIPIEKCCVGTLGAINEKLEPLLLNKLGKNIPGKTYAVQFTARNNSAIKRDEIISLVNCTVTSPHKVNLDNPDILIIIEVICTWAGVSVIDNPKDFGKNFNIHSLVDKPINSTEDNTKKVINSTTNETNNIISITENTNSESNINNDTNITKDNDSKE